jgi:hypothetical protein
VKGSVRAEEAAGASEVAVCDAEEVVADLAAAEVVLGGWETGACVWGALELGADAGGGEVEAGAVGVVEASGSTYCWLPADCASAAGAARTASAAHTTRALHTLRRLSIV